LQIGYSVKRLGGYQNRNQISGLIFGQFFQTAGPVLLNLALSGRFLFDKSNHFSYLCKTLKTDIFINIIGYQYFAQTLKKTTITFIFLFKDFAFNYFTKTNKFIAKIIIIIFILFLSNPIWLLLN